eukprot:scaffold28678_cov111-Isochrysis_galbana.AAC.9
MAIDRIGRLGVSSSSGLGSGDTSGRHSASGGGDAGSGGGGGDTGAGGGGAAASADFSALFFRTNCGGSERACGGVMQLRCIGESAMAVLGRPGRGIGAHLACA